MGQRARQCSFMNIDGRPWRTIWPHEGGCSVGVIDQTQLPHRFTTRSIASCEEAADAIRTMVVRGAPLIGVTGAYGLMLALQADPSDASLAAAFEQLNATRPTAINLRWALERVRDRVVSAERAEAARAEAAAIADEDVAMCEAIGHHGLRLFQQLAAARPPERQHEPLRVLTHCNAGWLATVDWGTALAPIYKAHRAGMAIHVWVDETRPRNQGASLTAFELGKEGVPHTVIVDNAGGHLMQHGVAEIPIEARNAAEVTAIQGRVLSGPGAGEIASVQLSPDGSAGFNPGFDVTPARLVSALITERGVAEASEAGLRALYGVQA
jgi:methylthioribose-1-phosphate isomerase